MEHRRVLIIAGSDSSGGAGLEADQKVIAYHKCYALTTTTALTAQNTIGVRRIYQIPPDFVAESLQAVLEDVGADVIKIGMLASAATIQTVTHAIRTYCTNVPIVLDPVMVATSGAHLLPPDAAINLVGEVLPMSTVLTPNLPEAKLLLRIAGFEIPEIRSRSDLVQIAGRIRCLGPKYVLLKGGHLPLSEDGQPSTSEAERHVIVNVLHDGSKATLLESDYVKSKNTHGTGCSLASAIAAQIALHPQTDMVEVITAACQYIDAGIRSSLDTKLGQGNGPIQHFPETSSKGTVRVKNFALDAT